jgi:hypothetical protein
VNAGSSESAYAKFAWSTATRPTALWERQSGVGWGATVGASLSNPSLNREGEALLLGSIGAIAGGFFGRDFPLIHGKVIYKR